ncbi:MAG: hypothetical protein WA954_01265 [Parerythrobacter sp.]
MTLLGIRLTILAGKTIPAPLPRSLTESIASVKVIHSDEARSGFQIEFQAGRDRTHFLDPPHLSNAQLKPDSRIMILVTLGVIPQVLMDGFITDQQFSPGSSPGESTFTIIGEDVSIMMDKQERTESHVAQSADTIARKIIAQYSQYGLVPLVIPPTTFDTPSPTERVPTQQLKDLDYLRHLAKRHNYVFYVSPGPLPGANTAYWGPPIRSGIPQPALSHNLGIHSNVESLSFRQEGLKAKKVAGKVQDRLTNTTLPVFSFKSLLPALSNSPPDIGSFFTAPQETYRAVGKTVVQAYAEAQATADRSTKDVVTAEGELNALRYGGILQARSLVGVRGVGLSYSGNYAVKNVTHTITRDAYKQKFTLAREGTGTTVPVVKL